MSCCTLFTLQSLQNCVMGALFWFWLLCTGSEIEVGIEKSWPGSPIHAEVLPKNRV